MKTIFLKNIIRNTMTLILSSLLTVGFAQQMPTPTPPPPVSPYPSPSPIPNTVPTPYPTPSPSPVPNNEPNPIPIPAPVVTTPSPVTTPNRVLMPANAFPQQSQDTVFRNPEQQGNFRLGNPDTMVLERTDKVFRPQ